MKLTAEMIHAMPETAYRRLVKLMQMQDELNEFRRRLRDVVGKTGATPEFRAYTDPWLKAFADDPDQPGSIESLIDTIKSKYLDDDGEPWKDTKH